MNSYEEVDCWTQLPSSDEHRQGTSHPIHGENVRIKEEEDVGTYHSVSSSTDVPRERIQLKTPEGDIITIKQEPEDEVFQLIQTTEDVEEQTDSSTQHENVRIKEEDVETYLSVSSTDVPREGIQLKTPEGDIITIKQEPENKVFQLIKSTEDVEEQTGSSTQHDKELDNGEDNRLSHLATCSGEKSHLCLHCSEEFSDTKALALHRKTHTRTAEKLYKCTRCKKTFPDKKTLHSHRIKCAIKRRYKCPFCCKFIPLSDNDIHVRMHFGQGSYQCSKCSKKFEKKCDLNRHFRKHIAESPYTCSYCDRVFAVKSCLSQHKRTHTGERPYQCIQCSENFSCRYDMTKHRGTHTSRVVP